MTNYETAVETITGYAEAHGFRYITDLPEGTGGTVYLENGDYKIMVDVMDDNASFHMATIHFTDWDESDPEEKNHKSVKRITSVKSYLSRFEI